MSHRLSAAIAAMLAAALCINSPSHGDTITWIDAGPAATASGVRGYEIHVEDGPAGLLTCRIVGDPATTGELAFETEQGVLKLHAHHAASDLSIGETLLADGALRIDRDGITIATIHRHRTPEESCREVLRDLRHDPAWALIDVAAQDAALANFLTPEATLLSVTCQDLCDLTYPPPADCSEPANAVACCLSEADRLHCRAICSCDSAPNPASRRMKVDAAYILEQRRCHGLLLEDPD